MLRYAVTAVVTSGTAVAFVLACVLAVEMIPEAWRDMMGKGKDDE